MAFIDEMKFVLEAVTEDVEKGFKAAEKAADDLGDSYDDLQDMQDRMKGKMDDLRQRLEAVKKATAGANLETGKMPRELRQVTSAFKAATSGAGAFAIAMMGIQAVISIVTRIKEAAQKAKEEIAKLNEEAAKMASDVGAASVLVDRYEELARKANKTRQETAEMENISQQMVATYGMRADAVDAEGRLILTNLDYMKEQLGIQRELTLLKLEEAEDKNAAKLAKAVEDMMTATDNIDRVKERIAELKAELAQPWDASDRGAAEGRGQMIANLEMLEATYERLLLNMREGNDAVMVQIEQSMRLAMLRMGEDAAGVTIEMQNKVTQDMRTKAASGELFGSAEIEAALRDYLAAGTRAIAETAENLELLAARERAAATDVKKMTSAIGGLDNAFSGLNKEIRDLNDLQTAVDVIKAGDQASQDYALALDYLAERYGVTREQVEENIGAYQRDADIKATLLELNVLLAIQEAETAKQTVTQMYVMGNVTVTEAARMTGALDNVLIKLKELAGQEGLGSIGINPSVTWRSSGGGGGGGRSSSAAPSDTALDDRLAQLDRLRRANQITADEEIMLLWRAHDALAKTTADREKVYNRILQAQRDAVQKAYDIDVYFGRRTLERQREQIRQQIRQHKAGTDARIALEEQLYKVTQQIRERDTESLSRLGDAVVTALRNRYDTQRREEEDAIEASQRAWREWADLQIEAINEQIRALDDLTKDEDRTDEERRRRRKIAALEQQLQYETDAYNQRKLQEQIAKEQADLDKWLARVEREDLREELMLQQEEVAKRAELEQRALDDQLDALGRFYDDRTQDYLLQAEAEQLMLTGQQKDIVRLIESFAPEYNAAGKTLGERLFEGFMASAADIGVWFETVNSQLETYQARMASTATAAAMQYWAAHGTPTAPGVAADPGRVQTAIPPIVINLYDGVDSPAQLVNELERMLDRLSNM